MNSDRTNRPQRLSLSLCASSLHLNTLMRLQHIFNQVFILFASCRHCCPGAARGSPGFVIWPPSNRLKGHRDGFYTWWCCLQCDDAAADPPEPNQGSIIPPSYDMMTVTWPRAALPRLVTLLTSICDYMHVLFTSSFIYSCCCITHREYQCLF